MPMATAQPYEGDCRALLTKQVQSPVYWQKTVENLVAQGADTFIEVGPGKTLSGLVKKINTQVRVFHVEDAQTLAPGEKRASVNRHKECGEGFFIIERNGTHEI